MLSKKMKIAAKLLKLRPSNKMLQFTSLKKKLTVFNTFSISSRNKEMTALRALAIKLNLQRNRKCHSSGASDLPSYLKMFS